MIQCRIDAVQLPFLVLGGGDDIGVLFFAAQGRGEIDDEKQSGYTEQKSTRAPFGPTGT